MAIRLPAHVRLDDLYSTGIIGLIKAIERYDLTRKNKFETYAILLIKGAIIDEMRSHDWVPRSVHQKANMISKAQQELEHKLGREATNEEIANSLKMSLKDFEELLSKVRPAVLVSLNADVNDDSERGTIADKIPDKKMKTSFETADRNEFRKLLEKTVSDLPEQERMVLVLYYYENLMLKEIAEVMRVSESRVSQVHTKALLRLRGRLHDFSEEFASFL
jgi:RNA polymerase sigma factor for flagellar operon FliA